MVANSETNKPLVSFVVNCYNGEKYLNDCLLSILKQTYKNWELIFWDNSSEDNSKDIFLSYDDSRFKYFSSSKNVNLGQAREWAVNNCSGEYIAFLDVDDEWIPEKTEIQVREMLKDNYVLSYGGMVWIEDETKKTKVIYPKYESGYLFSENMFQFDINMATSMIKRSSLLEKEINFDKKIVASEEYCLYMQLIYKEKVCVINEPIAKYLVRQNSLTNQSIRYWTDERIYTLNKILEKYPESSAEFPKEFNEAFARAEYYKLRYNLEQNNIDEAKKSARKIYQSRFIYFVVAVLLYVSHNFLKFAFRKYYNR
tara:strand:- start:6280 stop:7215 length:936 start_codon:yes stop_codon:yes gene_type:complete